MKEQNKLLLHFDINKGFKDLYGIPKSKESILNIIIFIRVLSINLISVFLPAFFIQKLSLWAFAYYFGGYFISSFISAYLITHLVQKRVAHYSLFLSVVSFGISMLILQNNNLVSVFFGALFLAFAERAFWLPLHYAYPFNIKQKEQEYALINAIAYLAPFLSPLLGLFIVDNFGYNNLFLAALLIYCLVFVFFFFLKPFKFDHIKIKPYFKFEPLYVADAFKINILGLIWPAFLLLSKWPLENIIFLFSACYFISGLTSLFNASYLKPEQRKALSTYAALLHSMSIITRIITNPVSTAIAALIGYTSNVIFDAHYMAYFYHRAKLNISEVFSRELNIAFTYFVIFLFSLVLPLYTDFTYLILMLITASGSFYVFKFFRNNEFKG